MPQLPPAQTILFAFCAVTIWTFLIMAWDKLAATRGWRRVPERTLLMLALMGGSPGALAASQMFNHKTSKQPFAKRLLWIAVIQLVLIGPILYWRLG